MTEQVTGTDLVQAQFEIAGGASLSSLGLSPQSAITSRGFALQARVAAVAPGTLTAYKEPAGPGVRVDGSGYVGYAAAAAEITCREISVAILLRFSELVYFSHE